MTETVIDDLEPVKIKKKYGVEIYPESFRTPDDVREAVQEQGTVRQSCKDIVKGVMEKLFLKRLP